MGWSVADESAFIFLTLKRGAVPRSELMVTKIPTHVGHESYYTIWLSLVIAEHLCGN